MRLPVELPAYAVALVQCAAHLQQQERVLDPRLVAAELGETPREVRSGLATLEAAGLLRGGLDDGLPPIVTDAGRQYVARAGRFDPAAVWFLPRHLANLDSRWALREAAYAVVGRFRQSLLLGRGAWYAHTLMPPGFRDAVDDELALDLFAAAVALTVRLEEEAPPGCLPERVVAVAMMREARVELQAAVERCELTGWQARTAAGEVSAGLSELLEQDDAVSLNELCEPADAALALERGAGGLRVVDRRVQSPFRRFEDGLRRAGPER